MSERIPASRFHAFRAVSAVLGAFVGIRKSADRDRDLAQLKPLHLIVAGVIGAALFVTIIVIVVNVLTGDWMKP